MTRTITLTRSAQYIIPPPGEQQSYRFTVTASDAADMPNEVFRMKQRPLDPIAQTYTADFDGICSPADLTNLPIVAPLLPNPLFRVAFIDITYYNIDYGNKIWKDIKKEVEDLVESLNASDVLSNVETVVITGDEP